MIANTLIFLLGVLVTALAAMVLAPLFWRKAQSIARREFEATIPISANEIRAEFDRVRAEAAVSVRRQEVLSAEARDKAAKAEADRGRLVVETTEVQKRNRRLTETIEEQDLELQATRGALVEREAENRDLAAELAEMRQAADATAKDFEALQHGFRDLGELTEEQAIELVAAKARIERLEQKLTSAGKAESEAEASETARLEALAAEVAELRRTLRQERAAAGLREDKIAALTTQLSAADTEAARIARDSALKPAQAAGAGSRHDLRQDFAGEPPQSDSPRFEAAPGRRELPALDPAEEADIRERISDVAARVIRLTALAEGPGSPLASLLDTTRPEGAAASPDARPTLADRVRLLAEADRKTGS